MYRLIIADDEQNILDGISNLFPWAEIGFCVSGKFCDGITMLDYLHENPVDVVLSDIEMPGMSGIEFCRRLQMEKHECHMILFSGYQNYNYFRTALTCKVFDYILKPVRFEDLKNSFLRLRDELDARNNVDGGIVKGYYEQVVDLVDRYILAHYQTAHLEGAAATVNLSTGYLSRLLKEKTGVGFTERLTRIRMEKAKELLGDVSFRSYEIASHLGYDNPKSFSRVFKSYFGTTPTEYRCRSEGDRVG